MKRVNENALNTDIYARINEASMSASEREAALNALRNAEVLVDGYLWVLSGAKRLIAGILERPADLKHSH